MTTYNSWAEAARASIDERWGPMCEAKNNRAMVKISRETTCPLCKHLTKRHPNAQCGWDDRRKTICPLSDDPGKTSRKCCLDFREWDGATGETGGFPRASPPHVASRHGWK